MHFLPNLESMYAVDVWLKTNNNKEVSFIIEGKQDSVTVHTRTFALALLSLSSRP